jgi:hypothetical protein
MKGDDTKTIEEPPFGLPDSSWKNFSGKDYGKHRETQNKPKEEK